MERLLPAQLPPPLLHILLQRDALDELHDDIVRLCLILGPGHVIDRHNIGVGQHGNGLRLLPKPAAKLFVVSKVLLQDLDRHKSVESMAFGLIDHGHTPGTDALQYLISFSEELPYVPIHSSFPPLHLLNKDSGHIVRRPTG